MNRSQIPFRIKERNGESDDQLAARAVLNPLLHSALTVGDYAIVGGDFNINALVDAFEDQVNQFAEGNLESLEAMLFSQVHALHAISSHLFRRAIMNDTNNLETFLKLGLKAQSQCKSTCEVLANMKSPKTQLNQTNIAQTQQVNNHLPGNHSAENQHSPSKILDNNDHEPDKWLDTGAQKEAIRTDQDLEAVEARHRTKNS